MSVFWQFLLWLIYFLSPVDLFPDVIPVVGWIDDFLLLVLMYWFMWRKPHGSYYSEWAEATAGGEDAGEKGSSYSYYENKDQRKENRNQRKETGDPYRILGIDRSATQDEIRRAYHAQAGRYHPDKVSHLGEEFQELAHKKFQEIQWAYELLQGNGKF